MQNKLETGNQVQNKQNSKVEPLKLETAWPKNPNTTVRSPILLAVLANQKSMSFFVPLLTPKQEVSLKTPPSFTKIALDALRAPPHEILQKSQIKHEKAKLHRDFIIQMRKNKLKMYYDHIKIRVQILKYKQKLQGLKTSETVFKEHPHSALAMPGIKSPMRNRAVSDSLVDDLKRTHDFTKLHRLIFNNIATYQIDDNLTADEISPDSDRTIVHPPSFKDYSVSDEDSPTTTMNNILTPTSDFQLDQTRSSAIESPERNGDYIPTSPKIEKLTSPQKGGFIFGHHESSREKLSVTIKRSKSMPSVLLEDIDDYTSLELSDLIPPVNRFTLRELELDEILSNAQLRHDLVFDPELKFKPNTEQDADACETLALYWEDLESEVQSGSLYRIPLIMAEVRAIIVELIPNGKELKGELWENIDVLLIQQQMERGIMDSIPLVNYLASLIKTNCAPIRDVLVDKMVICANNGKMVETLKILYEILELMKLVFEF
jgi:hypothetical protein